MTHLNNVFHLIITDKHELKFKISLLNFLAVAENMPLIIIITYRRIILRYVIGDRINIFSEKEVLNHVNIQRSLGRVFNTIFF